MRSVLLHQSADNLPNRARQYRPSVQCVRSRFSCRADWGWPKRPVALARSALHDSDTRVHCRRPGSPVDTGCAGARPLPHSRCAQVVFAQASQRAAPARDNVHQVDGMHVLATTVVAVVLPSSVLKCSGGGGLRQRATEGTRALTARSRGGRHARRLLCYKQRVRVDTACPPARRAWSQRAAGNLTRSTAR